MRCLLLLPWCLDGHLQNLSNQIELHTYHQMGQRLRIPKSGEPIEGRNDNPCRSNHQSSDTLLIANRYGRECCEKKLKGTTGLPPQCSVEGKDRLEAFRRAMRQHCLPPGNGHEPENHSTVVSGDTAAADWLSATVQTGKAEKCCCWD